MVVVVLNIVVQGMVIEVGIVVQGVEMEAGIVVHGMVTAVIAIVRDK